MLFNLLGRLLPLSFAKRLGASVAAGAMAQRGAMSIATSAVFILGFDLLGIWAFDRERSTGEKIRDTLLAPILWYLTLGTRSFTRQIITYSMLRALPQFPEIGRSIVMGARSGVEARTMASVPFAYSSFTMDHAFAVLQYSRQQIGEADTSLGTEAAMFSARYLQR